MIADHQQAPNGEVFNAYVFVGAHGLAGTFPGRASLGSNLAAFAIVAIAIRHAVAFLADLGRVRLFVATKTNVFAAASVSRGRQKNDAHACETCKSEQHKDSLYFVRGESWRSHGPHFLVSASTRR